MAEERMLNDEILLGLIKANSGGGGGGTGDYDDLENKPQIAGTTLSGNKSLADLGIASATALGDVSNAVTAITDGQTINSFADVETALTSKQDALTAGDYINLNNGNISVNRNLVGNNYDYEIKSTGDYKLTIIKSQGGTVISTNTYDYSYGTSTNIDNNFTIAGGYSGGNTWVYTALKDSTTHSTGYTWTKSVEAAFDETEAFPSEDLSGYKLVIKSEMDTALAGKVNAENGKGLSTNDYSDTEKTQVATNASDIGQLKSGLTNLDNEVNGDATVYPYADVITIPDAVPSNLADCKVKIEPVQDLHGQSVPYAGGAGKNKLPMTVADIKAANTEGTWTGNSYVLNDITWTISTDDDGNVIGIDSDGTSSNQSNFFLLKENYAFPAGSYKANGVTGGSSNTYSIYINTPATEIVNGDQSITFDGSQSPNVLCVARGGVTLSHQKFYPMIRLSTETDATFAPYTNYCPITGHTEASVQRDGKNKLNFSGNKGSETTKETTSTTSGAGTGDISGTLKAGTYTFSNISGVGAYVMFNASDYSHNVGVGSSYTFDYDGESYLKIQYGNISQTTTFKGQLELGSSATDYEPYQGKTYTIALGDTIYGGTVDFDSGVMTVTHGIGNMLDLSWSAFSGSVDCFYAVVDGVKPFNVSSLCSSYKMVSSRLSETNDGEATFMAGNGNAIYVRNDSCADVTAFEATLSGATLCYELATPTTIQLTPTQIQLLKGTNTLTASTGDISVTVNGVSGSIGAVQEQVNEHEERIEAVESGLANIVITQNSNTAIEVNDSYEFDADITAKAITIGVYRYGLADSITVLAKQVEYWNNNNELYFVTGAGTDHVILKMQYNGTTKKCTATVKESTIAGIADTAVVISVVTMY